MGNEMWRFMKCHWGLLISGSSYDIVVQDHYKIKGF